MMRVDQTVIIRTYTDNVYVQICVAFRALAITTGLQVPGQSHDGSEFEEDLEGGNQSCDIEQQEL
jgi:hypothetical protein